MIAKGKFPTDGKILKVQWFDMGRHRRLVFM